MTRSVGSETRESVAAAAARCFARFGYQGTSTAQIAVEAGVSEGTLFNHFGSKQALLVAALERARQLVTARLGGPVVVTGDSMGEATTDAMAAFADRAQRFLLDPAFIEATRLRAFALALVDEPEVAAAIGDGRREIHEFLAATFGALQGAGGVRGDVSADDLADIALGYSYEAAVVLAVDPESAPARIGSVVRTLIDVLRSPAASTGSGHG